MPFCGVGGKTVQRKLVLLGDGACGTGSPSECDHGQKG